MSNSNIITRRVGYAKSGFAFHFVRCNTRKAFADFVTKHATVPFDLHTAEGATICRRENVFAGLLPEAAKVTASSAAEFIVECYIVVPLDDRFEIDADKDRTNWYRKPWYHEIGHAVDFCAQHLEIIRRDHGVVSEGQCSDEETRALLNEFLLDAFDKFIANSEDFGSSGLLDAMPWAQVTKTLDDEEYGVPAEGGGE